MQWCEEKNYSCYFLVANQLHSKVQRGNTAIAFSWFDDHMYLYADANWCKHMNPKPISAPNKNLLSCEARGKTPPFSEWEPFSEIKSGDFYAKDMAEVRETLFKHNHIPKVTLRHKGESTRKLTLHLPGGKRTIQHIDEENSAQIAKLVDGHS